MDLFCWLKCVSVGRKLEIDSEKRYPENAALWCLSWLVLDSRGYSSIESTLKILLSWFYASLKVSAKSWLGQKVRCRLCMASLLLFKSLLFISYLLKPTNYWDLKSGFDYFYFYYLSSFHTSRLNRFLGGEVIFFSELSLRRDIKWSKIASSRTNPYFFFSDCDL